MMRGRMVFGKVISFIENALFPVYKKLALADAVTNPIETHVDGFGALLFDTLVGNTSCSAVVSLDRGRWLRMAVFFKTNAQGASLFTIVEKGCKLRFGSTGEDFFQNLAVNVDGTVGGWVRIGGQRWRGRIKGPIAEVVVARGAGASFRNGQIGCIARHV